MADVLLRELSSTDIDWMVAVGQRETIVAGDTLVQLCKDPNAIYLLLDGSLAITIPQPESNSGGAVNPGDCREHEVTRLSQGEMVGETSLFDICFMPAVVKALANSLVLAIPRQQLVEKLEQDINFSTHFYRAIALMLSERLRQLLEMPGQAQAVNQPLKEALFVFGELRDSDIDWFIAVGELKKLAPGNVLTQASKPIDALYIILDGLLLMSAPPDSYNPLTLCFECAEKNAAAETAIAYMSKGEISGAISFLDFRPLPVSVKAVNRSLVLSIPRQQLAMRLQQDMGFASRFYRVLAIQLSNSLQMAMSQMGCSQKTYNEHQAMDEDVEYDDELDLESLQHVSQSAIKFNWMLKRLGVV